MYNVVLFWLVIFAVIYVFTKKDDPGENYETELNRERDLEEKKLEIPSRRNELSKILDDGIDENEKNLEMRRFNSRCFNCGTGANLELDHHLPLSRGYPLKGEDIGSNTVILCRSCNRQKGDKLPWDFYTEEKLRQLEDMGVKSHLYYSPARMIELENLLIGEKIKKLEEAVRSSQDVTFTYYDMSRILFVEESINIVPRKIHNRRNIGYSRIKRDWYLEGTRNELYNIRWIFNIKIKPVKNKTT